MSLERCDKPMYRLTCDYPGCVYQIPSELDVVWYDIDSIITQMRDDEPYCEWGTDGNGHYYCPEHVMTDDDGNLYLDGGDSQKDLRRASDELEGIVTNTYSDSTGKPQEEPITEEIEHGVHVLRNDMTDRRIQLGCARAWNEGYQAGREDARNLMTIAPGEEVVVDENPYESEEK